jgi:hypothetical protein
LEIFFEKTQTAIESGRQAKGDAWLKCLQVKSLQTLDLVQAKLKTLSYERRLKILRRLSEKSNIASSQCGLLYLLCKTTYEATLQCDGDDKVRQSISLISECNQHYESCKQLLDEFLGLSVETKLELDKKTLEELYENFQMQSAVLHGLNSKLIAQNLFRKYMLDEELWNHEIAFQIIDFYRDAIIKTREKDLECEAEGMKALRQNSLSFF